MTGAQHRVHAVMCAKAGLVTVAGLATMAAGAVVASMGGYGLHVARCYRLNRNERAAA